MQSSPDKSVIRIECIPNRGDQLSDLHMAVMFEYCTISVK